MYISLRAFSVDPGMTDRFVWGVGARFPPSALRQVSILQLPASQLMPHHDHGVVWHRWCVYTPIDCVFTDRWFRGGGGGAARMVVLSLEF